jgi:hypothetical protein
MPVVRKEQVFARGGSTLPLPLPFQTSSNRGKRFGTH